MYILNEKDRNLAAFNQTYLRKSRSLTCTVIAKIQMLTLLSTLFRVSDFLLGFPPWTICLAGEVHICRSM
jgi:hypothetical protein